MISARKTGSSWLDRLRTAKGFTENDAVDLENYLQNPNSPNPAKSDPIPTPDPNSGPILNEDQQLINIMSNVLHELFNFGKNCDDSIKLRKKVRKQSNPRICAFSKIGGDEKNNVVLRSGGSDFGVEGVEELAVRGNEGEEDGRDVNFSGFSRTEVTVIDTSYESWKSEKYLYRKKSVWRVRDKKGKSEVMGSKKKRKVSVSKEEEGGERKKRKVDERKGCGEECELNEVSFSY